MVAMVEDSKQDCVLQRLLSRPDPEQFPPFRSFLILLRDLVMVPPPQDFEQDDQNDQMPQTHSSGNNNSSSKHNKCFTFDLNSVLKRKAQPMSMAILPALPLIMKLHNR